MSYKTQYRASYDFAHNGLIASMKTPVFDTQPEMDAAIATLETLNGVTGIRVERVRFEIGVTRPAPTTTWSERVDDLLSAVPEETPHDA